MNLRKCLIDDGDSRFVGMGTAALPPFRSSYIVTDDERNHIATLVNTGRAWGWGFWHKRTGKYEAGMRTRTDALAVLAKLESEPL